MKLLTILSVVVLMCTFSAEAFGTENSGNGKKKGGWRESYGEDREVYSLMTLDGTLKAYFAKHGCRKNIKGPVVGLVNLSSLTYDATESMINLEVKFNVGFCHKGVFNFLEQSDLGLDYHVSLDDFLMMPFAVVQFKSSSNENMFGLGLNLKDLKSALKKQKKASKKIKILITSFGQDFISLVFDVKLARDGRVEVVVIAD